MMDLSVVQSLVSAETGLAVVATTRAEGSVQASVVNAGIVAHPLSRQQVVGFVTAGGSLKQRFLRARPACAITFRRGWRWATVEGDAELIGPDDALEGVDAGGLRMLLRDIFTAAGGTHDDWAEYDRVMAAERRAAVLVQPRRAYGTPEHPRG